MRKTSQQVHAGGQPIDLHIAMQAAEWLSIIMSGEATQAEQQAWASWRAQHPDHERAWTHIEKVSGGFRQLDAQAGRQALARRPGARRQGLKLAMVLATFGASGALGLRTQPARTALADLSTGVGQRRELLLADGSRLHLNTDSAVNLHYSASERRLELVRGEVFITTAQEHGRPYRPFLVDTMHGQAKALGTRYSVRQEDTHTVVAVEQGTVRATARDGHASRLIEAGQGASMTAQRVDAAQAVSSDIWGWRQGLLLADGMPLGDFLRQLGRYRHGLLGCDDGVAGLRISGVFPLQDTEAVLLSLPNSLPVQIHFRTRFWVRVQARAVGLRAAR
ncbi:FecR domain-containing protein [Janthinobacterium psychrotolerans]|uniref:Transmembrane sensor n=1 Tax=Janthinobacterium psychrotolerans TaxID=1747903 RepID=A0A1A7C9N8_9BURK|nr:FecR domain-containing protein [Janthinobacterium psychrotolerans]OBV41028.1 transmembrane sensor [Janthinobacterium psychrotolerans]